MKNYISNVDVDVLVNNKPIKQHNKDGEIFVEAKEGTEYEIRVKNNNSSRIEAVIGVDGINVISGESNTEQSTGYVIDPYDTLKLKGYRISDEKVAAFQFCKKGESYASAKTVEAQTGVITIQCHKEVQTVIVEEPVIIKKKKYIYQDEYVPIKRTIPYDPYPQWGGPVWGTTTCNTTTDCNFTSSTNINASNQVKSSHNNILRSTSLDTSKNSTPSDHFDMGSTFGEAKESLVKSVTFDRGICLGELNIYYASRNSLKDLGVNLSNEQKVVFPQGVQKYCTPPKNWKG